MEKILLAINMKETAQTFKITFGALVAFSIISFSWKFYQEQKLEAVKHENCQQLNSLRNDTAKRIDNGEHVSDAERLGAYQAGVLMRTSLNCP